MENTGKIICLGVAIMLGTVSVGAADTDKGERMHGPRHSFEEIDTNADGQITREEIAAHRADRFAAVDTDGDGALSEAELTAQAEARTARRVARMIKRHDANGDGVLSQEEMESRHKRDHFKRMDTDGDGAISAEEFAEFKPHRGHGKGHGKNKKSAD
ncbi:calcium-binding protein [Pseudohalocynthiibacter aestuariivivens]|uniref:EF-hand domain-containing protein n=1 Tax=Roseovarius pelagicus TaxID=2980108 RepID=A0ABY6D9N5_9RHOB|nr:MULTISPECIES: EF-hand domain-containing protein [Rhodobacterales]QIE45279.1 calcium-binding protein [Pseudohalocynthiibacter aestuariivivens]UXX82808.1 EF-hand domain-containing protein [Roseovarius pelagicus]